jgi:formate C-acetyltransferase
VEPNVGGKMSQWSDGGHYNFGSAVEFALSDGYHHISKQYLGLRTGDPLKFDSFDKFVDAVKKQLAYSIKHIAIANSIMEDAHRKLMPYPFASALIEDCIAKGLDREWGGAKYDAGPALIGTGVADVANSLAAVKKLVFDNKVLNIAELVKAIDANFEGYEPLRLKLISGVPKYGNDDD